MSKITAVGMGIALAMAVTLAQPSWGQEATAPDGKPKQTTAEQEDNSGSPEYSVGRDRGVDKEKREALRERKYLYYTYPPAYRYPAARPYYYRNTGTPSYFYGGGWPRGYRLGPVWIDPNVGNAGFSF